MALIVLARDGDLEGVLNALAQGEDVDEGHGGGWTPLMNACLRGHLQCVRALIDAGANVDRLNSYGLTALIEACMMGHAACARALIDAGAPTETVAFSGNGNTALMHACMKGHVECARVLIEAGAPIDRVNFQCETPLMHACSSGHHECARALIEAQADLELTNHDGKSALMIACESPDSSNPPVHRGRARCALALLGALAPIREADFHAWAASLKFACERLQLIEGVLATSHVIEYAPALEMEMEVALGLKADAQGIVTDLCARWARVAAAGRRRA